MASPGDVKAGGAYVEITADSAPLEAAMGLVEQKLKGLGGIATKIAPEFLIVGAAIGAIGSSVQAFARIGGEMKQMQEQTGIAANTLLQLQYAAQQSESSIEAVTTGVRFLQRNLVNASEGSKQASQSFSALGLSFQTLQGMDTQGQLMAIADAIKGLPTATQRTAAAMDIFGRGGAALVPLLKQGSGAIKELMSEAEKMGLVMGGDAVEAADNLGDTWSKLGSIASGLAITIGQEFAPAVQGGLDLIVKAAVQGTQDLKSFFEAIKLTLQGADTYLAGKETRKNAEDRAKALEAGAKTADAIARQEIKTAQDKEAAIKASEDRNLVAQKGVLGASDVRLKAQWDAGMISAQDYYNRVAENQAAIARAEMELAQKRAASLEDAKAKETELAAASIAQNRLITIEEERRAAVSKARRDEEKASDSATLSARLAVAQAIATTQETALTTAYQQELKRIEDAANQEIISAEDALKQKTALTEQYNEKMKAMALQRVDEEMSYLVSQMDRATTEAERIQLQAQMDVLKEKAKQIDIESKKPINIGEIKTNERAISVGKVGATGFQEQFGAVINRSNDDLLSENKRQSGFLENIDKNISKGVTAKFSP